METELCYGYDFPEEIGQLFSEYTDMLIEGDSTFREYLALQNYEEELAHLDRKYGLPFGRLYLVRCGGEAAGCIGLRKIDEKNCEMKRLYVRPKFRGNHIARDLVGRIIRDAREIGYSHMLLDTLPFLREAVYLYRTFGFYETKSYNNSPVDSTIYMKLEL